MIERVDYEVTHAARILAIEMGVTNVVSLSLERQEDHSWVLVLTTEQEHTIKVNSMHTEPREVGEVARGLPDELGDLLTMGLTMAHNFNADWFAKPGRRPQ
jgi:hypothetical protein